MKTNIYKKTIHNDYPEMMIQKKYYLKTYGCQMNVNDSEYLIGQLEDMGFSPTLSIEAANIILLNTCCVRKNVEEKIFSLAGKISQIKKNNQNLIFVICGCLAQKNQEELVKRIPFVDIIIGPSQIMSFTSIFYRYLEKKKNTTIGNSLLVYCNNREPFVISHVPVKYQQQITAYLQIMKGCNNFCSYCIVPYTRGPETSRPSQEILKEVHHLLEKGFREIFLLGQNVNSYGNDGVDKKENFVSLLQKINNIDHRHLKRIRFTTSHPKDFSLDLVKMIKNGQKICEHIHLPIQSGSDPVLFKMNRKYNMEKYMNIINNIRNILPSASITTDIMVGFPGETEDDFNHTLEVFKAIEFDAAYSFIYSEREGTLASIIPEQIPLRIKKERLWKLMELQKKISTKINQRLIGKTLEVLIESHSKKGYKNQYWGKTRTNKVVVFNINEKRDRLKEGIGETVYIKIQKTDSYTLYGELTDVSFQ